MTDNHVCAPCRALLPWYAAGAVSAADRATVARHLADCAACSRELVGWQSLASAVQQQQRAVAPPAPLAASWQQLLARLPAAPSAARDLAAMPAAPEVPVLAATLRARGAHLWRVLLAQPRLLRPAVWIASALAITLAILYAATLPSHVGAQEVLSFALPLIAGTGMAFLYGPEIDPGLELTLATPTSARAVLFGRFALLFAYDALLALAGTILLAALRGDGIWALTLVWLGPVALLSTISLVLSLLLHPVVAAGGAAILWLSRVARYDNGVALSITPPAFWRTTPLILAVSLVLLIVALYYAPRRERLAREE